MSAAQRGVLDKAVQRARDIAERAADGELRRLGVAGDEAPPYLEAADRELRNDLRQKARQLGDSHARDAELPLLRGEIAYEQWHRLLFARFLIANDLLHHPRHGASMSLEECADSAEGEGLSDGWSVAATFAAQVLPGVFPLHDPAVRVRFGSDSQHALESIVEGLSDDLLTTEDALGWVYQFWQTVQKKRVNESGRKIGGADLAPVTQLFTEDYMVRFLLENSLGAWWAARHPGSPLIAEWEYLRHLDDGTPAAGTFPEWPSTAAEVTVMDPCCGSGHFLVAAFGMLWRMRAEEEGLSAPDAQDAVLRDNLYGLELDPRCTQIALFAVVLEAWKQGGHRSIPEPQVACSGVTTTRSLEAWLTDAAIDPVTSSRLRSLFRDAEHLGSLIDPRRAPEGGALLERDGSVATWDPSALLAALQDRADGTTGAARVTADGAMAMTRAAALLGGRYVLVVTNPPYLKRSSMDPVVQRYVDHHHPLGRADLATAFIERSLDLIGAAGSVAVVSPQNWLQLTTYRDLREQLLDQHRFDVVARLGSGAFRQVSGEVVKVSLAVVSGAAPHAEHAMSGWLAHRTRRPDDKAELLRTVPPRLVTQRSQRMNPDTRLSLAAVAPDSLMTGVASGLAGIQTGDYARFGRCFWERPMPHPDWELQQSTVPGTTAHGGREHAVWWEEGRGALVRSSQARIQGLAAVRRRGVAVSQMGDLPVTLYTGELFDNNTAVILPRDEADLPAIWAYCSSPEFTEDVRELDDALKVTNATLVKVAFDRERWAAVAEAAGPLPDPRSDEPTQWLFEGSPASSTEVLEVGLGRLLGYGWPQQDADSLDGAADADGIVALPAVAGEAAAATRLRSLLTAVLGDAWSPSRERDLVAAAGGKTGDLEGWLRASFFTHHCSVFHQRPFLWQIWDGRKDGFSAIVNYHRLDHALLSKLTFTTLGAWIDRQRGEVASGTAGAEARLTAAQELQRKLQLILDGEAPYDIHVRWKPLHEQAIGWHPDLDDGVRMNIRPFVEAGVLRSKVGVHWRKDRGTNLDGSGRHNDLHLTLAEKRAARAAQAEGGGA